MAVVAMTDELKLDLLTRLDRIEYLEMSEESKRSELIAVIRILIHNQPETVPCCRS